MNTYLKVLITFLIFIVCTSSSFKPNDQTISNSNRKEQFKIFIKGLNVLKTPIQFNSRHLSLNGFRKISKNSIDTLFFKDSGNDDFFCGVLQDTINNFKILYLGTADILIPCITVFTKEGEQISSRDLYVQDCGESGIVCGYKCSMTVIVYPDNSIFSVDSTFISLCDTITDKEIPNTTDITIASMKGIIESDGKIKFSEITKKVYGKH